MLSQRFINSARTLLTMLLLAVVAGCASGPSTSGTSTAGDRNEVVAQRAASKGGDDALSDEPVRVIPVEVQTLYEQASAVMASGDRVDAELRFKEFVLLYPEYPGAWVNLGIIHAENGDDVAARTAIDSALGLDPAHPAALNQLGMLLRRNGNFLEAEAAYLKAVTVSPDYALAHYNLGVLNELYLQRLDAALQHFEAYQALAGEDKQVAKWITDLRRRTAANQRTANVAD
ncbi:MAG: tetratricopeptide repeat protein [Pseudomonadota bacterium]